MENNVESDRNENWMKPQLYRAVKETDLLYSKFNRAAWDIENWPDWMKREAGIMTEALAAVDIADENRSLMLEHVALEQELARKSFRKSASMDTQVKTPSLLDTLTTKQLDALLVMARYGWHSTELSRDADSQTDFHKVFFSARECVKPLLFPSEDAYGD